MSIPGAVLTHSPERKVNANHRPREGAQTPPSSSSEDHPRLQKGGPESPKGWPRGTPRPVSRKTHGKVQPGTGVPLENLLSLMPRRDPYPTPPSSVKTCLVHLETHTTDTVTGSKAPHDDSNEALGVVPTPGNG